ncbi:glycine-rich domain-containing protein [Rummeliibacillus sp. JY-2-4R]
MTEVYKFFNSAPGDIREYYASDFSNYFSSVLSAGLLLDENQEYGLQVTFDSGLNVKVSAGKALIKGYSYENTTDLTLAHSLPETTLDRIDRVVLRLDLKNASRFIKVFVKEGVASASPVAPELQRDQYIYELSLAQVILRANTASIVEGDITDERSLEDVCGIVQSLITVPISIFQQQFDAWFNNQKSVYETDITEWQTQEKADFEAWVESLHNVLDGDVAGNLANQITTVQQDLATHQADLAHVRYIGLVTGTNSLVATSSEITSLVEGLGIAFKNTTANTGAVTLNINSLGAKSVLNSKGEVLEADDLIASGIYTVRYNGSNFILQGSGGGVSKTAQISGLTATVGFDVPGKIQLDWTNPVDTKYKGIVIRYKLGSYPTSPTDGTLFYDSNDATPVNTFTKTGFTDGTTYYIRAFAYTYKNATRVYTTDTTGAQTTAVPLQVKGIQTFTASTTWTVPAGVSKLDVHIVGGGGAGGSFTSGYYGAAGGGGGYTKPLLGLSVVAGTSKSIVVGAGGIAPSSSGKGGDGGASSFDTYTAAGGKGGGSSSESYVGGAGGAGGGTGGGDGINGYSFGGDGGFDGANGQASARPGGVGQGTTTKAFGETSGTLYSGGGGGGSYSSTGSDIAGAGGAGGGGKGGWRGSASTMLPGAGSANTGGGGGGGNNARGGAGGSGIVVVRWGY